MVLMDELGSGVGVLGYQLASRIHILKGVGSIPFSLDLIVRSVNVLLEACSRSLSHAQTILIVNVGRRATIHSDDVVLGIIGVVVKAVVCHVARRIIQVTARQTVVRAD